MKYLMIGIQSGEERQEPKQLWNAIKRNTAFHSHFYFRATTTTTPAQESKEVVCVMMK